LPSHSTSQPTRQPRVFYGWIIVASAMCTQMILGGLGSQGFGAFILPLQREFGWSKGTISIARSLMQVENGLLGPIEGFLVDRLGPRVMIVSGLVVFGAGMILLGLVNSLWMYFVAFGLVALGNSLSGFVPTSTAINLWFIRKRTMALSFAQTGQGLGAVILIPFLVLAITQFGWRDAATAVGILTWVIGIPVALLMRRHNPEYYGMQPDGAPSPLQADLEIQQSETATRSDVVQHGRIDFTLEEVLRTPAFWLIGMGHGFSVMVVGALITHQFAHMGMADGMALSFTSAALIVTVLNIFNISGRFLIGLIGDRFDKRYLAAIGNLMGSAALIIFALGRSLEGAMVYAVIFGIAWGIRGPLMTSIRGDYFGRAHFGKIIGTSSLFTMCMSIVAPIFAGFMADWQGNYRLAFIILALISALGAVCFLLAKPPKPPLRVNQVN
jgi:sugar phosphate permease